MNVDIEELRNRAQAAKDCLHTISSAIGWCDVEERGCNGLRDFERVHRETINLIDEALKDYKAELGAGE